MRHPARLALVALTILFVGLGLVQGARDAPTVDEGPDLAGALVAIGERDLRITPEHGALYRAASGILPVLFADPIIPKTEAYRDGAWFDYTDDLISANERAGRLEGVLFWFRVAPLLAGAGTAWALHAIGRRLGGELGGLFAGGMWLTTPYVLGLSHLGSLDVAFSLTVVGLVLALIRDGERPSPARLVTVGVVLGAALTVRHSAVVLAPVMLTYVALHRLEDRRAAVRATAFAAILPLLVVWGVHRGVDPAPVEGPPSERFEAIVASASAQGTLERLALAAPMPMDWRAGFAYLALTSDERPAYLFGETWEGSRVWFFPASALVKLPLTATAAMAAGLVVLATRRRAVLWLAPPGVTAAVLSAFLLLQPLNLGLRLALPVVALAMVPVAALAGLVRSAKGASVVGVAAALQVAAMVAAHPNSLAWTPPPFADGYRWVSDSSIDFGQALHAVRRAHREKDFVAVTLVAPRGLDRQPPGTRPVTGAEPTELVGRVAVGATPLLVTDADELSWLRAYCPVEVLDDAVLVYEFESPPDQTPASGPPAPPCDAGTTSFRE